MTLNKASMPCHMSDGLQNPLIALQAPNLTTKTLFLRLQIFLVDLPSNKTY